MKKIIALITALVILGSFAGCAQQGKQVPDGYLTLDVENYVYAEEIEDAYTYTSSHSYDTDTGMDHVTIELRVNHIYADEVVKGTVTYQYNRSTDTWNKIRDVRWGDMHLEYKADMFEKTFSGKILYFPGNHSEYEISVENLDFINGTITCRYHIVAVYHEVYTADGSGTFNLNSGYWSSFDIPVDDISIHFTLDEQTGIYSYWVYSSPWG